MGMGMGGVLVGFGFWFFRKRATGHYWGREASEVVEGQPFSSRSESDHRKSDTTRPVPIRYLLIGSTYILL